MGYPPILLLRPFLPLDITQNAPIYPLSNHLGYTFCYLLGNSQLLPCLAPFAKFWVTAWATPFPSYPHREQSSFHNGYYQSTSQAISRKLPLGLPSGAASWGYPLGLPLAASPWLPSGATPCDYPSGLPPWVFLS